MQDYYEFILSAPYANEYEPKGFIQYILHVPDLQCKDDVLWSCRSTPLWLSQAHAHNYDEADDACDLWPLTQTSGKNTWEQTKAGYE